MFEFWFLFIFHYKEKFILGFLLVFIIGCHTLENYVQISAQEENASWLWECLFRNSIKKKKERRKNQKLV